MRLRVDPDGMIASAGTEALTARLRAANSVAAPSHSVLDN